MFLNALAVPESLEAEFEGRTSCLSLSWRWCALGLNNQNFIEIAIWPSAIFKLQEAQYFLNVKCVSTYHFK